MLSPIKGYEIMPLVPLEKAVSDISNVFDDIEDYVYVAKENCKQPANGLSQDESASIHLYTMEFGIEPSLYKSLNEALRAENRRKLTPWFPFLKLFLTALYKLPSCAQTIWRGIRDVNLSPEYPIGKKIVWWGVSSCTRSIDILESHQFLGKHGTRTLFSIECKHGKSVESHSYFKNAEHEIILKPGSYFEVIGQLSPAVGLYIIHLKEIDPPIAFVKPPFANFFSTSKPIENANIGKPIQSKSATDKQHLPVQNGNHVMPVKPKPLAAQYSPHMQTLSAVKPVKMKPSINKKPSLAPNSYFGPPLKSKPLEGKYFLLRN
ncbi:unnamed protein product [Rotaria sp. Silwood2]|nr:unnamed protein product [Rotaria sp. Silwood2]